MSTIRLLITLFAVYLFISFVKVDMNPFNWETGFRVLLGLGGLFYYAFILAINDFYQRVK